MGGCQSDNSVRDSVQVKFTSALMKHDTSLTQQLLIDPSKSQIQLKMFEVPLVFGIQNTGWTCDGETFLVGGCMSNLNHPAKSIDVSAYFDIRSNIVFCNSCVNKLAKHDRNLLKTKWNGYFVHRAKKHTMEVDCLMMIRGFIRAYGVDDKGEFLLSGTYSQKTDRMFSAIKKYAGKQAITYNGIINERRDRIKGKWLMNDGATTNVTNEFKFQTKQIVDFSIPFKDIIPQQGNLKISQHKCELKGPFKEETKWACDGRTNFAQGCQSFITGFDQAQHVEKYKCSACDFDLCIECAKYSVYVDKIVEDHQKQSNGVWKANKKSKDKSEKEEIKIEQLMINQGIIYGLGEDEGLKYFINGYLRGSKVKFVKTYHEKPQSFVTFKGTTQNSSNTKIIGSWVKDLKSNKKDDVIEIELTQ